MAIPIDKPITGIPDPTEYGDISRVPLGQVLPFVIQEHLARRAGCFIAGTPVRLADGSYLAIEHTFGCAVSTNKGVAKVTKVLYNGPAEQWMRVQAGNREVIVTPMHLFYVEHVGWTPIFVLAGLISQVDEEGILHVQPSSIETVLDLRQRVLSELVHQEEKGNLFSQVQGDIGPSTLRQAGIQDAAGTLGIKTEDCVGTAQKSEPEVTPAGRLCLAAQTLYRVGLGAGGDRSSRRLHSNGYKRGIEAGWNSQENGAQRTHHRQMVRRKELALEGRCLQPRDNWEGRQLLAPCTPKKNFNRRTWGEMRVVWKNGSSHRTSPHCGDGVFRGQQSGELATAMHEMPWAGGKDISKVSGKLLCITWLPRATRARIDIEVEGAHCYIANGFLVHNSHRDIRIGKDQMFSWATKKPGLPLPGEMQAMFQTPLHEESYMHYQGNLPKGMYGAGSVRPQEKGSVIVHKAEPNKVVFSTAHSRYPQTYVMIRTGKKPTDWIVRNLTPKSLESFAGPGVNFEKEHYKSVPEAQVGTVFGPDRTVSEKIDGARILLKLKKHYIDASSYRPSVTGSPIMHTDRMRFPRNLNIPNNLVGTTMLAEAYGERNKEAMYGKHTKKILMRKLRGNTPPDDPTNHTGPQNASTMLTGSFNPSTPAMGKTAGEGGRVEPEVAKKPFLVPYKLKKPMKDSRPQLNDKQGATKAADDLSYRARHMMKLVKKKNPEMLARLGGGLKGLSRVDIQDKIRGLLPDRFIGKESPGYVYRAAKGGFAGKSGFETGRAALRVLTAAAKGSAIKSKLWVAPSAQDVLHGNYQALEGMPVQRFKLPEFLAGHVTPAEGDPRGNFWSPGRGRGSSSFSKYKPSRIGGASEMILDRHAVSKYLAENPKAIETLPRGIKIPDKGINHPAVVGPAGEILASSIPVKPSVYYTHPELRPKAAEAIPMQELGGILNSSLAESLRKQEAQKVQMRAAIFNILSRGKKPVGPEVPYSERVKMMQEVLQHLPAGQFHLPRMATTPEEQQKLWDDIKAGRNPRTSEGIVSFPQTGVPTKVKLMPEADVVLRSIFPGEGKYKGIGAGGFEYGLPRSPIDFPKEEHGGIAARLAAGKNVYTTRAEDEMGRYSTGMRLSSPVGALRVASVKALTDAGAQHPFADELTPAQRAYLTGRPGDLVELHKDEDKVVGRVGTGLSDELRAELHKSPQEYIGRTARIRSMGQFPSGAHRAPALIALHEDEPVKTAVHVGVMLGYPAAVEPQLSHKE